jgi:tungstate transport system substrate-binding protein
MRHRTWRRMLGWVAALGVVAVVAACTTDAGTQDGPVILATTTSTYDSGLLDELVPAFEEETGHRLDVIAVGSGQAIELGRRGEADVVLAHSPEAEQELVDLGVTGERALVMYNDFVVLGPVDDPAQVAAATSMAEVMERLATGAAEFVSRGDDSGTHALELALWDAAGIDPSGAWYRESGQGMGATLQIAAEAEAYTLTDRGTWLATELQEGLAILFEDDPALFNLYHVIPITRAAGERVQQDGGQAFAEWIVDEEVQELIGLFGIELHGQALFVPAAGQDADDLRGED